MDRRVFLPAFTLDASHVFTLRRAKPWKPNTEINLDRHTRYFECIECANEAWWGIKHLTGIFIQITIERYFLYFYPRYKRRFHAIRSVC